MASREPRWVTSFSAVRASLLRPPDYRARIESALALALDAVEHLVDALDTMDGDPDLEEGGDAEPSLGAPEGQESQVVWLRGTTRDLEIDRQPEP